jgi:hypothetical protein
LSIKCLWLATDVHAAIWDYNINQETPLPDMPTGVARTYPASVGVAMLPLTLKNNYTITLLFCGGTDMPDEDWGDYNYPAINTWNYPASADCQRITPEPADGSPPAYVQDDDMLDRRTMGQFIILPTGKLLMTKEGITELLGTCREQEQLRYLVRCLSECRSPPAPCSHPVFMTQTLLWVAVGPLRALARLLFPA